MKQIVLGVVFITGAVMILLAIFFMIFNIEAINVSNVLQIFFANIIICSGIFLINNILIRNIIVEYLMDVVFIIVVLISFGAIFDWYSIIPIWVLVCMAVVIYIFAVMSSITKILKDTKKINELLEKRRKRMKNIAS